MPRLPLALGFLGGLGAELADLHVRELQTAIAKSSGDPQHGPNERSPGRRKGLSKDRFEMRLCGASLGLSPKGITHLAQAAANYRILIQ
ncbi:MAG: hypothetical protein RB191_08110 [Terriglobia bacterium]|nr:hypothetical protein [Terriglobia bacterium]